MSKRHSCGILLYKRTNKGKLKIFLVESNSPRMWNREAKNIWSVPKGGREGKETPLDAAKREFSEEVGINAPKLKYQELITIEQRHRTLTIFFANSAKKKVKFKNSIMKKSRNPKGKLIEYPEIRDGKWLTIDEAYNYILPSQKCVLTTLEHNII